jgi:hypothetical protein
VCGSTYKVSPSKFLYGQRCPICRESKGEQRVHCLLKDKNIFFHRQYEFADCINKLPLPFDFAIFDRDGKLILLIEYDGEYHYQPIISNKQLKYQQKNDQIKTNYCLAKNIPLLRIPYWEFDNIEQILTEKLAEFESPEKVAFFI